MNTIEKVELQLLRSSDYDELLDLMKACYPGISDPEWKKKHTDKLLSLFPQGQIIIRVDGQIRACALAFIIDYSLFEEKHFYVEITGNFSFSTHNPDGDVMYGLDLFVHPDFRGLRLGRRMYDYRKELCEELNLKGIVLGGRIPNYHKHHEEKSKKQGDL